MRGRTFEKRALAAAISRAPQGSVEPLRADFEASIYDVAFQNPQAPQACVRFSVLALNPEHAERLGRLRLRAMGGDVPAAPLRLAECVTFGEFSAARMATLLEYETLAERDDRRQAWARGEFPNRVTDVPVVYVTEDEAAAKARAGLQALAGWR